jgi:ABC-type nickel/cobalt efflux system permease component RcnA
LPAFDEQLARLGGGGASMVVVLAVSLLLGLRHATDPDHLAAVSTLIAANAEDGTRRAGRLGLAWGLGHATTLIGFGLPMIFFQGYPFRRVQTGAEVAVGLIIMALAARLLVRWRWARFHVRSHRHGRVEHHDRNHIRGDVRGRSSIQAYGIGVVHGTGGSAGLGLLLLDGLPNHAQATAALVLFALAAAVSMTTLSSAFGFAITRRPFLHRVRALAPAMAIASLLFGAWYTLGVLAAVPYPL